MSTVNSFGTRTALAVGGRTYQIFSLPTLHRAGFSDLERLPYSMKVLLENLLRHEDGRFVKQADIEALARWDLKSGAQKEMLKIRVKGTIQEPEVSAQSMGTFWTTVDEVLNGDKKAAEAAERKKRDKLDGVS